MTTRSLSLDFPDDLYDRVRRRNELESLNELGDESLWQAAQSHLAPDVASQLESLNLKQQREGLTKQEQQTQSGLLREYERAMLIRAEAAVLLKARGYDVAGLIRKG
jgi:hypothetical protein